MRRRINRIEVALHFVWTTHERWPLVTPDMERMVYRCIEQEARRLKADVLALNGMPDHVHLVVLMPTTVSIGDFMKQVKGISSSFIRNQQGPDHYFRWEPGYGVFACSRSHRAKVIAYVENQKNHHAANTLWPEWENPDLYLDVPPSSSPTLPSEGRLAQTQRSCVRGPLDRDVHVPGKF